MKRFFTQFIRSHNNIEPYLDRFPELMQLEDNPVYILKLNRRDKRIVNKSNMVSLGAGMVVGLAISSVIILMIMEMAFQGILLALVIWAGWTWLEKNSKLINSEHLFGLPNRQLIADLRMTPYSGSDLFAAQLGSNLQNRMWLIFPFSAFLSLILSLIIFWTAINDELIVLGSLIFLNVLALWLWNKGSLSLLSKIN